MSEETGPDNRKSGKESRADDGVTRRRFVAGGVAIGAAVVWTSPFPFADAAIGQLLPVDDAQAAGSPTGPAGPTGSSGAGPEAPTESRARIHVRHQVRVGRQGRIFVGVDCVGDQTLTGTARLQGLLGSGNGTRREVLSPLTRHVALGHSSFRVAPGRHKRIEIRLSPNGRRLLRQRGTLRARLIVKTPGRNPQRRTLKLISALH